MDRQLQPMTGRVARRLHFSRINVDRQLQRRFCNDEPPPHFSRINVDRQLQWRCRGTATRGGASAAGRSSSTRKKRAGEGMGGRGGRVKPTRQQRGCPSPPNKTPPQGDSLRGCFVCVFFWSFSCKKRTGHHSSILPKAKSSPSWMRSVTLGAMGLASGSRGRSANSRSGTLERGPL